MTARRLRAPLPREQSTRAKRLANCRLVRSSCRECRGLRARPWTQRRARARATTSWPAEAVNMAVAATSEEDSCQSPRRDQQSALLLSLPNGSPSSPFWTTFSLRTIDIIVIRRRRPFNAALSLPRGESTAPGSRPDAHSGRGGAQTPGRRPGPRTEARVHPICGISSTRHV